MYVYMYVRGESMKQINLSLPENLFEASKEYAEEFGYKNVQELILDIIRRKVLLSKIQRYKLIEGRMIRGEGTKKFSQKSAEKYIKEF